MKPSPLLFTALVICTACGTADPSDDAEGTPMQAAEMSPHTPTDAEHAEILAVLQAVFDGLAGDPDLIVNAVDPDIVMHSTDLRSGPAAYGSSTLDGLVRRVETGDESMTERMWDAEVRVSGGIAAVWTPYDFYVGSEFSHCGVDVATLMRYDDGWRIISLDWTRDVPPNCALHPGGPPSG